MKSAAAFAGAGLVGLAAALMLMPVDAMLGHGPGWLFPTGDLAQSLTGHLAFQSDRWHWPLLAAHTLFWPQVVSLALVDGNPLLSLLAKLWDTLTGNGPGNWLGACLAACWILQPVAAVYAVRALTAARGAAIAAAVLSVAWPALLYRVGHPNLCAHFFILTALGATLRGLEGRVRWPCMSPLLLAALLFHPYLFLLSAVLLTAVPLDGLLRRRTGWWRDAAGWAVAVACAVAVFVLLGGPTGGGDKGFATYSMNLLSPVWPQRSGVFGADLPLLDATGGQYEGFNWLGAGTLLLVVAALAAVIRRDVGLPRRGLVVVLACLALMSLSSRVYVGQRLVLDLGTRPWEDIFATFRASGRAFWPVGYAVLIGACVAVARLPRPLAGSLFALAILLQVVDAAPLGVALRRGFETAGLPPALLPAIPAQTRLFTIAPFPGCMRDGPPKAEAPTILLAAVRAGAWLGDSGLGRSPAWFACERVLTDAVELPLRPGEVRAFADAAQDNVNPALLGPGAACRRRGEMTLCGRDVDLPPWTPVAARSLGPAVGLPAHLAGTGLQAVLGASWRPGGDGSFWSEGPRATLLLPLTGSGRVRITLHGDGLAIRAHALRKVTITAGHVVTEASLPDEGAGTMVVETDVPADGLPVRLALDVFRPIDPLRRGMTDAPVRRAAIRLSAIDVAPL